MLRSNSSNNSDSSSSNIVEKTKKKISNFTIFQFIHQFHGDEEEI